MHANTKSRRIEIRQNIKERRRTEMARLSVGVRQLRGPIS